MCVGGPYDGKIHMLRLKIESLGKPVRWRCDDAALVAGVRGYYRSTDGKTMNWVTEP